MERNIQHPFELLQQIAAGLNKLNVKLGRVEIVLVADKEYRFALMDGLDVIANDIYWDERGHWADARIAKVEVV